MLALFAAIQQEPELARGTIARIAASPVTAESRWVEPARIFLENYRSAPDLPAACRSSSACADLLWPADLMRIAAMDGENHPAAFLRDLGLPVLSVGEQDVDGDGDLDPWLTLGDGVERAGIWLFVADGEERTPLQAGSAPANGLVTFAAPILDEASPIVSPVTDEGIRHWRVETGEAADPVRLADLCSSLASAQFFASARVFAAKPDAPTVHELEAMRAHNAARCPGWTAIYGDGYDAAVLAAIGLAAERAGDTDRAITAYLNLWRAHPDSAFAWIAQARLEPTP